MTIVFSHLSAFGTLTIPATVTAVMGLPATALAPMVFAVTRQFYRDSKILPTVMAKQKPFTPRPCGNSLNHRAVNVHARRERNKNDNFFNIPWQLTPAPNWLFVTRRNPHVSGRWKNFSYPDRFLCLDCFNSARTLTRMVKLIASAARTNS